MSVAPQLVVGFGATSPTPCCDFCLLELTQPDACCCKHCKIICATSLLCLEYCFLEVILPSLPGRVWFICTFPLSRQGSYHPCADLLSTSVNTHARQEAVSPLSIERCTMFYGYRNTSLEVILICPT